MLDAFIAQYRFQLRSKRWYNYVGLPVLAHSHCSSHQRLACVPQRLSTAGHATKGDFEASPVPVLCGISSDSCECWSQSQAWATIPWGANGSQTSPEKGTKRTISRCAAGCSGSLARENWQARSLCSVHYRLQWHGMWKKCTVRLCFNNQRNCFKLYHQKHN